MKFVSAMFVLHRHDSGDCLSELGIIILRRDLGFADRLEVRIDDDDAKNRIAGFCAVELIASPAEGVAADHDLRRALRVFAGRVLPLKLLRARRKQDELCEIPVEYGQIGDLLLLDGRGHVCPVGLEQLAYGRCYCDSVAGRARFKRQIKLGLGVNVYDDLRYQLLPEARGFDLYFVLTGEQSLFDEYPRIVRRYSV